MITQIPPNAIQHITPTWKALSDLSPFSSILASADESLKTELDANRGLWFVCLIVSTILVFIGVVLEEVEGWMQYLKKLLPLQPIKEYRLTKKLAKLGWILIVIGVLGEGVFEVLVQRADNKLQAFNEALLTESKREAGNAAKSADRANASADRVEEKADALDTRLDKASKKLIGVEEQVRAQGPRWQLLVAHKDEFVKALQPFPGQKAFIVLCGRKETIPTEQFSLMQYAFSFLNQRPPLGAGWIADVRFWDSCPAIGPTGGPGNIVATSTSAPDSVTEAAKALTDELNKIEISTIHLTADPKTESTLVFWFGADSAGELAIKNPDSVYLAIGPNPMSKQHK